ncbi:MAG: hypothetical protein EXS05_08465 [Planctomycetaceae bacterium]|nr:hypothetical protein [Planctomycetaceae bacterium]
MTGQTLSDRLSTPAILTLGGVSAGYFGLFGLLCVDGVLLKTRVLERMLEKIGPNLAQSLSGFLELIYAPLLFLLKFTGAVPD